MLAPIATDQRLTFEEFWAAFGGHEDKWELVEGVPVMMAGASRAHNRIVRNLVRHLGNALDGSPCEVFPSDMGVATAEDSYRLPDVGIYCDPRDLKSEGDPRRLHHPKIVFEVLSPGTARGDRTEKLLEYQALESVLAVIFIHPFRRTVTRFERADAGAWRQVTLLPGAALVLRDPAITLTAEWIFAGV